MMNSIRRYSPIRFNRRPARSEMRDGWEVVLAYEKEGSGPYLVDLSHVVKWDIQDADLAQIQPLGISIPQSPGDCVLENGLAVNRLNRTQAIAWHLAGQISAVPAEPAYTDITEARALLAVIGPAAFSITEKITSLDLQPRDRQPPFILQGPILHVPCQAVVLAKDGLLIAFARGYAHAMVEAILEAGAEWGLQPAGESVFKNYIVQAGLPKRQ
jgi:hypothetical protein